MKKMLALLSALLCSLILSPAALGQGKAEVHRPVKHDVSPELREMIPAFGRSNLPRERPLRLPRGEGRGRPDDTDATASMVPIEDFPPPDPDPTPDPGPGPGPGSPFTPGFNILGQGVGFAGPQGGFSVSVAPPDPTGAAGALQYVQMVNPGIFSVFDKENGSVLYGPAGFNTLFSGFGGPCEQFNDGDGIVQYDKAASRWVITQFAISAGPPYHQCIAVSRNYDALGSYSRYDYTFNDLNDYPKLGIWPDGYYMGFNMFQGGVSFVGARACALDRLKMIAGQPANIQCFQFGTSVASLLPSDQDGASVPPVGSPNYFMNFGTNSLRMWRFHADFANPANTTLTGPTIIPVAAFTPACVQNCVPQPNTAQRLDALGDRLMFRLAYRNFGYQQPESLLVNHSILLGNGTTAVRWYEIRNPGGSPTVFQQGTFAPDSNSRWMGSVAMDRAGDIALGYSVSSSFLFPGIRYAGRTASDPLGTLQPESVLIGGSGSQIGGLSRWGDYSHMSIDPWDDCTLWYTNEYLQTTGSFNWSTRIGSFKFTTCSGGNPIFQTPFFVRQQYVDVLGREPDPNGFQGWSNVINSCNPGDSACINAARISTARGFLESVEFRFNILCQRQGNCILWDNPPTSDIYMQEYVRQLYLVYLRREPEPNGYNAWLSFIRSTGDYDQLVGGFINSYEYLQRFGHP